MLEYLEAYCDINEIASVEQIVKIGKLLVEQPEKKIHGLSIKSYILLGFQELLQEKKTLEEFMTMGDISSKHAVSMPAVPEQACGYIETSLSILPEDWKKVIVLVDTTAVIHTDKKSVEEISKNLDSLESTLYILD